MNYIGEHLFPGQLGHFLAVLSLVASLLATISFFKVHKAVLANEKKSWLRLSKICFAIETISVVGIFSILYYIISSHLFEFKYAWQHSSRQLQTEYLLSCFWEGQEGSFMLWSFWHCVLGWIIIARGGKWVAPVMTIVSFAQFCLATMLIGIYFFGFKVGSSPFVLLRNEIPGPIFSQPNYLSFVKDGNGLNALLQNYWMVIHPPILFLGFASTVVPFAFAMAGFMTKDHKGWTAPALPWALFSVAILGTGIMMGAAWAYESLNFGGYWAWDPVENASLVPWLVMVAGVHTNLVYKHSGYSLKSTYLFYVLSFFLILYSTFLTRSGILGDTSVHAFTDLGMNVQLYLFLAIFVWLAPVIAGQNNTEKLAAAGTGIFLTVVGYWVPWLTLVSIFVAIGYFIWQMSRNKNIPVIVKEENTYSREFWMFIGALVFFLSAILIIGKTSLPVWNKVFPKKLPLATGDKNEFSYNQIEVFIAIIIGTLTAATQYLKYKDTAPGLFFKKISIPFFVSLAIGILLSVFNGISHIKHGLGFNIAIHVGVFSAVFAIVANAGYIFDSLKGKLKLAGPSVAHVGFGMVLLGILLSSGNKQILSIGDKSGMNPWREGDQENPAENMTLVKGLTTQMGDYDVTYVQDTFNQRSHKTYLELVFQKKGTNNVFKLYPDIIKNNKGAEGLTANPDAKHFLSKDIFTYISYYIPKELRTDTSTFRNVVAAVGDTNFYGNGMWVLNKLELNPADNRFQYNPNDTIIAADITVISKTGSIYKAKPAIMLNRDNQQQMEDTLTSLGLVFRFNSFADIQNKKLGIGVKESSAMLDYITIKAYEFPNINILWLGIMVTVIGTVMSMVRRILLLRKSKAV